MHYQGLKLTVGGRSQFAPRRSSKYRPRSEVFRRSFTPEKTTLPARGRCRCQPRWLFDIRYLSRSYRGRRVFCSTAAGSSITKCDLAEWSETDAFSGGLTSGIKGNPSLKKVSPSKRKILQNQCRSLRFHSMYLVRKLFAGKERPNPCRSRCETANSRIGARSRPK